MTRPNVEPAVEHVATYIKSRLQNEILYTASIAQEIEADGNKKKKRTERKQRTPMKKQGERRKGEEGRS